MKQVQSPGTKISKLVLDWCRLGTAGVRRVCQAIAYEVGSMTDLSLAHCEIGDAESICEMLCTPGLNLTKLDLSSNPLDDRHAAALAQAIAGSKLKDLKLRDSQISVPLPVKTQWFWGC